MIQNDPSPQAQTLFPVQISNKDGTTYNLFNFAQLMKRLHGSTYKMIHLDGIRRNISDPQMKQIITKCGKSIVSLSYQGSEPEPDSSEIDTFYKDQFEIMRENLKCVKQLCFMPTEIPRITWPEEFHPIEGLPNLECLVIVRCDGNNGLNDRVLPVDLQMLLNSPNLTSIHGYPLQFIPSLEKINKVNLVKSFFFQNQNHFTPLLSVEELNLLNLESLEKNTSRLEEFAFTSKINFEDKNEIYNPSRIMIQNILETSKSTLQKLTLEPVKCIKNVKFPRLVNLTHLILHQNDKSRAIFSTKGLKLNEIFPRVTTLDLGVKLKSVSQLKEMFPSKILAPEKELPFRALKCLKISNKVSPECYQALSHLFPHINKLTLSLNENEMENSLPSVFQYFSHISSLRLEFQMGWNVKCLDATMLGMKEVTVDRLRQLDVFEDSRRFRSYPSILDMTGLKDLTFIFHDVDGPVETGKLFTKAFCMYGLELMSSINLRFGFDFDVDRAACQGILRSIEDIIHFGEFIF